MNVMGEKHLLGLTDSQLSSSNAFPAAGTFPNPSDSSADSEGGIVLATDNTVWKHAIYRPANRALTSAPTQHASQLRRPSRARGLDWCDRGFHVDFHDNERLPLERGRFLGPGVQGGVYETVCKGTRLAWKTRYCPRGIQSEQRKELEILKKLNHRHVIKLMVAVCDLATFMEDIDILHDRLAAGEKCGIDDTVMMRRLDYLCPDTDGGSDLHSATISRLSTCFGCLTSVITYIHDNRVRHKDVKPSNILLSHNGLWLADFGISSDFSAVSISQSEAMERGTPKYFAPEVAIYDSSGRSADIFSLGCVFLEMVALLRNVPLNELKKLRPEKNGSFQANINHKSSWFALLKSRNTRIQHLLCEVDNMLNTSPRSRPSATRLNRHLSVINQFGGSRYLSLHGPCCAPERVLDEIDEMAAEIEDLRLALQQRDEYIARTASPGPLSIPRPPLGENRFPVTRTSVSGEPSEEEEVLYRR